MSEEKQLTLPERAAVALGAPRPMTQAYLKSHLHYDPETGIFTRLIANSPNTKVGNVAGWLTKLGYIELKIDGTMYKAHRLAWLYVHGVMPDGDVDHINLNRADNRIANLRPASRTQNQLNREKSPTNKSGFKGVSLRKGTGKYVAQASYEGKKYHLGLFDTPEQASEAYKAFAAERHGEFART
jgi:hypothetical protein